MNIPEFLDLATEIELMASELYKLLAANVNDPPISVQLEKLSNEEVNHANILQAGKTYYESMPDLFAGLKVDEQDARESLKEANGHHALFLQKKAPILRQLQMMLELEKRFESIHLDTSVKISDEALKALFLGLKNGDHSHFMMLTAFIDMLQEKP